MFLESIGQLLSFNSPLGKVNMVTLTLLPTHRLTLFLFNHKHK